MSLLLALTGGGGGGVNYSLSCNSGSYSLTGNNANLTLARKLILDSGTYSLTGNAANLVYVAGSSAINYTLSCDSGSYSLVGNPATLRYETIEIPYTMGGGLAWRNTKHDKRKYEQEAINEIKDEVTDIVEKVSTRKVNKASLIRFFNEKYKQEITQSLANRLDNTASKLDRKIVKKYNASIDNNIDEEEVLMLLMA